MENNSNHYGQATAQLVNQVFEAGAKRAVVLMRHSARTFDRNIHDLLNPLTDHGRELSRNFGAALPKQARIRGYASPPERCMETAQLAIAQHIEGGGEGLRTRPVEALGVFYALDQQKMWKGLSQAQGLADYVGQWFAGDVPADAMMPAPLAVDMVLRSLIPKLQTDDDQPHIDLCVTHDMTIFTMRHGVGLEPTTGPNVEFLDGLVLTEEEGRFVMRSTHGGEVALKTPI